MKLNLQDTQGNKLELNLPTHWGQVSLRTFTAMQGQSPTEQIATLCGITLQQYFALGANAVEQIATILSFVANEPFAAGLDHEQDIGAESIGQMELAKKVIADTLERGSLAPHPYLYAIYMMPERINFAMAFVQGFPENLAEEVRDLPVTQVYGPAVFFWARCLRSQAPSIL